MGTTINVTASGDDAMSGVAQYIFEKRAKALPGEEWNDNTWEDRDVKESTAKTYSYGYEGLTPGVTYELRVTVVDNAGNYLEGHLDAVIQGATITMADVGKTVDYKPKTSRTYSTTQNGTEYSGSGKQDFSTADITGGWYIWKLDSTDVYLISKNVTSKSLALQGARGYNNGVTLLDEICDTCFADKTSYTDMIGRNLKLEDVLEVKSDLATNGNSDYMKSTSAYTIAFPYIWYTYEQGYEASQENRSTAYTLTTEDTFSYKTNRTVYTTCWCNGVSWNSAPYWKSTAYFEMVLKPAETSWYWLSSRFVYNMYNRLDFSLHRVSTEGIRYGDSFCYSPNSGQYVGTVMEGKVDNRLRPIVKIPLTSCYFTETGNNGEDYHISPR